MYNEEMMQKLFEAMFLETFIDKLYDQKCEQWDKDLEERMKIVKTYFIVVPKKSNDKYVNNRNDNMVIDKVTQKELDENSTINAMYYHYFWIDNKNREEQLNQWISKSQIVVFSDDWEDYADIKEVMQKAIDMNKKIYIVHCDTPFAEDGDVDYE